MPKNRLIIVIIFFILTALLFEVAFLYDFKTEKTEISHESHQQSIWIFFVAITLSFVPCFLMGWGGLNPLTGFFPPLFLTSVFWLLLIVQFNRGGIDLLNTDKIFPYTAVGSVVISGFFGILLTSLTLRACGKLSDDEETCPFPEENKEGPVRNDSDSPKTGDEGQEDPEGNKAPEGE